ncbi:MULTISPECIES: class III lanthipeptide [unclassified Curtobacterium]|uniref:class III lanthipeptide n=1 Tax=unclassified Curtobacterium TaxID=257496 RepID=UPI0008DC62B0|nr:MULTISPECIES: class III lanthipeptide [unclassified Curtobacterium]OIH98052.1 hypothetical protein BIU92_14765 [Curtobacterium sp. MCBA15_003]OII11190.1 hypothetical protein BIU97_04550 [Curtobacterium sp. MCBA15_009]OII32827.1 hypothetical protein BIU94_16110 [Curtobacterium sp. MMLR14_006]
MPTATLIQRRSDSAAVLDLQGLAADDVAQAGLTSNLSLICKQQSSLSIYMCPTSPNGEASR